MNGLTSPTHLVILLLIVLLLFGAKRLPEIGSSLGKGMREFKGALGGEDEKQSPVATTTPVAPAPELATPAPAPVSPTPEPTPVAGSQDPHDTV
jgi:sec-independent protein translocase protein TatA